MGHFAYVAKFFYKFYSISFIRVHLVFVSCKSFVVKPVRRFQGIIDKDRFVYLY